MVLRNTTIIATGHGWCYKQLLHEAGLENIFKSVTGESITEYELDVQTTSEEQLIRDVLSNAPDEYILHADVIGQNERMYYAILQVSDEQ